MAEEVEMIPVAGAEPPKADPLAKPASDNVSTLKLAPVAPKPMVGEAAAASPLKPGLKLPPKPGLSAGLKLPPKPGATVGALRPGLKLPTQTALKPGVKLPPKPVIRKPGDPVAASALPKPVVPGVAKPAVAAPSVAKPVAPATPSASPTPSPMETLKSVTQKLKGVTQEIPAQAILHKTGIIAEDSVSAVQKEAAKHKTARISLSDAMGVAPVKDEAAPMKTIRIKRPIDIANTAAAAKPAAAPAAPAAAATPAAPAAGGAAAPATTVTQRKTLKIARPGGGAVRPSGKFGVKRPSQAATVSKAEPEAGGDAVADIPDIPTNVPAFSSAAAAAPVEEGSSWVTTLSAIVQFAACVAIGVLVWYFYENSQLPTFCGGLGWGA